MSLIYVFVTSWADYRSIYFCFEYTDQLYWSKPVSPVLKMTQNEQTSKRPHCERLFMTQNVKINTGAKSLMCVL